MKPLLWRQNFQGGGLLYYAGKYAESFFLKRTGISEEKRMEQIVDLWHILPAAAS
jgi:hypothetical protein